MGPQVGISNYRLHAIIYRSLEYNYNIEMSLGIGFALIN